MLGQTVELSDVTLAGDRFTAAAPGGLRLEGTIRDGRLVGRLSEGDATFPFAVDAIPTYPAPADRLAAWRQDLDALATRIPKVERSFTPATRTAFIAATRRLARELPALTDQQIMARMAAAMALARNAHTRLYLVRPRTAVRMLPLGLWWFADGSRIVRAGRAQQGLLGCRIDRIGGKTVQQARAAVAPLYAGVTGWRDYMSSYTLAHPDLLYGTGVIPSPERVTLRLSDCPSRGTVTLATPPLVQSDAAVESWWDLLPVYGKEKGRAQVLAARGVAPPLYLIDGDHYYWHRYLADIGTLYVQFNRTADDPIEPVADYAKRLLAAFDAHPVRAFVLDLRFNTGGNGSLTDALMVALRKRTAGMARYVITGRATFSAGIAMAARWRALPDVRFVGEPGGDRRDFWSEGGNILLPNSGLAAHFANGAHSYSPAPCPGGLWCADASVPSLDPDLPAPLRWVDYLAGRDPAMEAVLRDRARPPRVSPFRR